MFLRMTKTNSDKRGVFSLLELKTCCFVNQNIDRMTDLNKNGAKTSVTKGEGRDKLKKIKLKKVFHHVRIRGRFK